MSAETRRGVVAPSPQDVLLAAAALGYPALTGEAVDIAPGEEAWRAAVTKATALLVWETLQESDLGATTIAAETGLSPRAMIDDAHLLGAINAPARALRDMPPAAPFAPHDLLFWDAVAHAKRLGLHLPAFTLRWAHGGEQAPQHGETHIVDGRIVVTMNADLVHPVDVLSTGLHELQHVADAFRQFDRLEREQRAIAFAARALEQWP
jgi:hypothetical protein